MKNDPGELDNNEILKINTIINIQNSYVNIVAYYNAGIFSKNDSLRMLKNLREQLSALNTNTINHYKSNAGSLYKDIENKINLLSNGKPKPEYSSFQEPFWRQKIRRGQSQKDLNKPEKFEDFHNPEGDFML